MKRSKMKKLFLYSMIFCAAILASCNKDKVDNPGIAGDPIVNEKTPLVNETIFINDNPSVNVEKVSEFPIANETYSTKSASMMRLDADNAARPDLQANDYRFKLVAQEKTMTISYDFGDGKGVQPINVQASHVKITDNYAFVSYNIQSRWDNQIKDNIGGLVVYRYTIVNGPRLETVSLDMEAVTSIELPNAQINVVDFDGNKLYIAGASGNGAKFFGENSNRGEQDRAFLLVMELLPNMKFDKDKAPVIKQLTSFQATSLCKQKNGNIYVTTGDGTEGSKGGLYIFDDNNYNQVNFIEKQYARSVSIDEGNVYLMLSNPASIYKYDLNGNGGQTPIYDAEKAIQPDAKSEMTVGMNYLFVAQNEEGMAMLFKNGDVNETLGAPYSEKPVCTDCVDTYDWDCWCPEDDVTNSVWLNSDLKLNSDGGTVNNNLLLLANGRQGLYWYDITKAVHHEQLGDDKDYIASASTNAIQFGDQRGSANYVTAKGNLIFLANGLGGLKVLYVGFNAGPEPPVIPPISVTACNKFMDFIFGSTDFVTPLFPETQSVFRSNAHEIISQLFQWGDTKGMRDLKQAKEAVLDYIEITENNTPLFITYMSEGAGWSNALGYFVIPASITKNPVDEWNYWNTKVKPNMTTGSKEPYVLRDEFTNDTKGGIIFKYIRDVKSGGHMAAKNTYRIGDGEGNPNSGTLFSKGERVVLFMCPDGWSAQNNRVQVTFSKGTTNQIFFMHKYFNQILGIPYSSLYEDFKFCQINSFYSGDCRNMVLCIEDWHMVGTDVDFNDIIFAVSDNLQGDPVSRFVAPKWAVGAKEEGNPEIVLTENILNPK